MRSVLPGLMVLFGVIAIAPAANAATLQVSRGTLDIVGGSPGGFATAQSSLSLRAEGAGVALIYAGAPVNGIYEPASCAATPCFPGSTISLYTRSVGQDLPGVALRNGVFYPSVGDPTSNQSLAVEFLGSAIAPALTQSGAASVTVPFTFTGLFNVFSAPSSTDTLTGIGLVTLTLRETNSFLPLGLAWTVESTHFEFTAVPEPGTLLLLASGLGGFAARWRRRS